MNRSQHYMAAALFCVLACSFFSPQVRAADAEPLPSTSELHKRFDDGQYQPLLAALNRVLQLKGDPAKPYDRVELELLRGNTYLQLKQQTSALQAFDEAVKAISEQTSPALANEAIATRALVKRSQALSYTPKSSTAGAAKGISLLDMGQRKEAFTALLADTQAEVAAKAKAAAASKSLPPIVAGINSIAELCAIELMATGVDTASSALASQLSTQGMKLMDDAVHAAGDRAKTIDQEANVLHADAKQQQQNAPNTGTNPKSKTGARQVVVAGTTTYHKQGLNSNQSRELTNIIDTCKKVSSAAKDFATIDKQQTAGFQAIVTSADACAKEAAATLSADYSASVTR